MYEEWPLLCKTEHSTNVMCQWPPCYTSTSDLQDRDIGLGL